MCKIEKIGSYTKIEEKFTQTGVNALKWGIEGATLTIWKKKKKKRMRKCNVWVGS